MERALKFERDINNCIAGYKELYKELKKPKVHLSIKDFLIKKSTAQDRSESSPTVQNSITGRNSPLDNLMDISFEFQSMFHIYIIFLRNDSPYFYQMLDRHQLN